MWTERFLLAFAGIILLSMAIKYALGLIELLQSSSARRHSPWMSQLFADAKVD
jgi:hypothetical protein